MRSGIGRWKLVFAAMILAALTLVCHVSPAYGDTVEVTSENQLVMLLSLASTTETTELKLGADIQLHYPEYIWRGRNVTLDLAGHTLRGTEAGPVLIVYKGGSLVVKDSSKKKTGTITGGNCGIENNGTLNVMSGTITGNSAGYSLSAYSHSLNGGGIRNFGKATISGTITDNYAKELGGGIYNGSGAELTLNGGKVSNNKVAQSGGGIYVEKDSSLAFTGGTVSSNIAWYGGGIYVVGTLKMSKGAITKNTAKASGGGIFGYDGSTVALTGNASSLTITENDAYITGGGIDTAGDLSLFGASVKNNTAGSGSTSPSRGAGICCFGTMHVNGHVEVTGNTYNEQPSDTFLSENVVIQVEGKLNDKTRIGVCARDPWQVVTSTYGKYNTVSPTTYFLAEPDFQHQEYVIIEEHVPFKDEGEYLEAAYSIPIHYQDMTGSDCVCYKYKWLKGDTAKWDGWWYVAESSTTIDARVESKKNVNLILCDGVTVNVTKGVHLNDGGSFTTWAQSDGSKRGVLRLNEKKDASHAAGLGTNDGEGTVSCPVTINGGDIRAWGSADAAGVGGGRESSGAGVVTVNRGSLTAVGKSDGAGIGGGYKKPGCGLVVNGGYVSATAGDDAAGIGGGEFADQGGKIEIHGGECYAYGDDCGPGVGAGDEGTGGEVLVTGGKLVALAYTTASGIGGGRTKGSKGAKVEFRGGIIEAYSKDSTVAIGGGGHRIDDGTLTLAEGTKVSVGHSTDECQLQFFSSTSEQVELARTHKYVVLEICEHPEWKDVTYEDQGARSHGFSGGCWYCSVTFRNRRQDHDFTQDAGANTKSCVCGHKAYRISLGNGDMQQEPATVWSDFVSSGSPYVLPRYQWERPSESMMTFYGWASAGKIYKPGDAIKVTGPVTFDARWIKASTGWSDRYEWSADNATCTATRWYPEGSALEGAYIVETETAYSTYAVTTPPTCTEAGVGTYTATFKSTTFKTQTKTAPIPATGHDWGGMEYVWEWAAPLGSTTYVPTCIARRTCRNDAKHVETAQAVVTREQALAPSCTEPGSTRYTATFAGAPFETQTQTETIVDIRALGHDWGAWETTKQASATERGEEKRTCKRTGCGAEETRTTPLAHTHELKGVDEVPAGCTTAGRKAHYVCYVDGCGALYIDDPSASSTATQGGQGGQGQPTDTGTEGKVLVSEEDLVIPATGHRLGAAEKVAVTEATCTEVGGYDLAFTCQNAGCGKTLISIHVVVPIDSNAHDYPDAWTVVTEAKELEPGLEERTCRHNATHKETQAIPATGHVWGEPSYEWAEDLSTCTAVRICQKDDSHIEAEIADAAVETVSAGCEEPGRTTYTADFENPDFETQTQTVETPALGHDWDDGVVTLEPTCSKPGERLFTCRHDPSHTRVEEEIELPHTVTTIVREHEVPATCTEDGGYDSVFYCDVCGQEVQRIHDTTLAFGHDWGDWEVVREATESEEGEERRTCWNDHSHTETRAIPKPDPERPSYRAVSGDGITWTKGSTTTADFTFKRSVDDETTFDHFNGVLVDGVAVGETGYQAERGSVVVRLQPDYLETLELGRHTLTALFDDGDGATAEFTVVAAKHDDASSENSPSPTNDAKGSLPDTSDDRPLLPLALMVGLGALLILGGRRLRRG